MASSEQAAISSLLTLSEGKPADRSSWAWMVRAPRKPFHKYGPRRSNNHPMIYHAGDFLSGRDGPGWLEDAYGWQLESGLQGWEGPSPTYDWMHLTVGACLAERIAEVREYLRRMSCLLFFLHVHGRIVGPGCRATRTDHPGVGRWMYTGMLDEWPVPLPPLSPAAQALTEARVGGANDGVPWWVETAPCLRLVNPLRAICYEGGLLAYAPSGVRCYSDPQLGAFGRFRSYTYANPGVDLRAAGKAKKKFKPGEVGETWFDGGTLRCWLTRRDWRVEIPEPAGDVLWELYVGPYYAELTPSRSVSAGGVSTGRIPSDHRRL